MKKFLFGPINSIMKKRKSLLDRQFEDASLTEKNALKLKDEYEAAVKSVKNISEQIVADAKVRARTEHDKIVKETETEAGIILEKAQQKIELERSRALHKMEAEIAELAIAAAAKIVNENSTEENNHKLYDQFLAEVSEKSMTENNQKQYGQFFVKAGEL